LELTSRGTIEVEKIVLEIEKESNRDIKLHPGKIYLVVIIISY
jgi:hypothetical protein